MNWCLSPWLNLLFRMLLTLLLNVALLLAFAFWWPVPQIEQSPPALPPPTPPAFGLWSVWPQQPTRSAELPPAEPLGLHRATAALLTAVRGSHGWWACAAFTVGVWHRQMRCVPQRVLGALTCVAHALPGGTCPVGLCAMLAFSGWLGYLPAPLCGGMLLGVLAWDADGANRLATCVFRAAWASARLVAAIAAFGAASYVLVATSQAVDVDPVALQPLTDRMLLAVTAPVSASTGLMAQVGASALFGIVQGLWGLLPRLAQIALAVVVCAASAFIAMSIAGTSLFAAPALMLMTGWGSTPRPAVGDSGRALITDASHTRPVIEFLDEDATPAGAGCHPPRGINTATHPALLAPHGNGTGDALVVYQRPPEADADRRLAGTRALVSIPFDALGPHRPPYTRSQPRPVALSSSPGQCYHQAGHTASTTATVAAALTSAVGAALPTVTSALTSAAGAVLHKAALLTGEAVLASLPDTRNKSAPTPHSPAHPVHAGASTDPLTRLTAGDVLIGTTKGVVFGLIVAAVGCLRGLQTQKGPSAVGASTTRAVVSSILLIIVTDAGFSILLYVLRQ